MIDPAQAGPVVVDTNVFTARFGRPGHPLFRLYEPTLAGRAVHLSFVTLAEARYGARLASWGTRRLVRLEAELARVDVVWPTIRSRASMPISGPTVTATVTP